MRYDTGVIAMVVVLLGLKYYSLTNDLELALSKNETMQAAIALKNNVVSEQSASLETLKGTITTLNAESASYEHNYNEAKNTLAKWRSKPAKIKYVTITKTVNPDKKDYSKGTCDDGLKLNRHIAGLEYEAL